MNNPLEAVTQAVNSLVTALKLPDESAKANEVLGEMSFPQFSRLLPYRDYNQESGLFMNDTTMGFMLEAIPINGANESIVEALDHMLRTKLPRGIPLCIHLMSSQLVGDRIEYGLREFSWSGEQAERFNAITRAYYMKAAATQFPLPEGMNLPLTLRHYRVFISYCSPSKKKSRADILEMENLVKIIRASLQGASITTQTVDAQAFIDIVGEMINHNPDSLYPKRRQLDPYSDLNYQCVEDSFDLKVRADYLTLGLRENGRNSTARILNFHLARNPEIAFLWNVADNYSNLLNPELSISCPFILTLTLVVEDQVKTHSEANLKYMDLEKKSKTSYAKWFPSVEKEAKEWGELRQRLGSGQSSVVSYFLNITAFCKDNNETALEVEQDILNSFRKNGFELISPRFNHMRNFLTCLPFMAGKGLFKQLKEAGVVQRAESFNVANLMPLVADNPLTPAGLLAPTYRNQLAFIDIFFRGMNNTNYNMAVCGTSGAGKTGLIQPLIRSVLDSGGFAVVFDMGDGYKSLCENMGGVYLDGETLRFNPFANITDIDQSAERVRDQLSVMASPNGNLDEVHEGLLLQAVRASWLAKENRARIDDVVDFLKNASDSEQYAESPTIRSRLDEMIVLLDQYTANGTYGQYFNSDEPSLRDDAKMVVLELGGLEDRPSLLVAVMFSLIIYIENRMYRTPRNLKKLNVIDEGWRLLDFKNHKVGEFIEKGYRTARRHTGAYITITQNIVDFDSDKASSAARAAWGNSSYKIILKQSAKEFAKYNQLYPDQFLPLQRDMIGKFGAAKDQWFSSFLLQVENHSSWHRLFVDPLSRAMYSSDGPDFEFVQQKRKEGLSIHEAVWQLAWKKSGPEMASLEAWLEEHEKYRSVGMSSTQKPADVTAERRRHWWWTVPGCLAMVLLNAAVSYGIVRLNAPVTVAFNMKQTVDAFFDSASQKQLSEAQSKALSARFNTALEASLQAWQQKHHAVILVSPAVVQGAPDITREIQQDIARRMRAEP
ncbi:type IV secretion system protein TraC [Escherichia coli]|nr:type IV secretion system protein TraC [Escherichia coli]EIX9175789.1 type IV secretion system protein TraC [Klebsiella pneumoniae]EEV6171611.1 type IV secretion system protein TraC [Escherichia coli]EEW1604813.1 type IV secretion system protein TraC [Escherichia coli]EEZ6575252.1 type IV secretion system protein TraC [Escherichia coli]